jgi:hypothetical protein
MKPSLEELKRNKKNRDFKKGFYPAKLVIHKIFLKFIFVYNTLNFNPYIEVLKK